MKHFILKSKKWIYLNISSFVALKSGFYTAFQINKIPRMLISWESPQWIRINQVKFEQNSLFERVYFLFFLVKSPMHNKIDKVDDRFYLKVDIIIIIQHSK